MLEFVEFCGQYCDALQGTITSGVSHIDPAGQGFGEIEPSRHRLPGAHWSWVEVLGQKYDAGHEVARTVPGMHICDWLHCVFTLGVAHWNPAGQMLTVVEFCGQY